MSRVIAIFDLDGTITRRDTYLAYLCYVLRRRALRALNCFGLPFAVIRFKLGQIKSDEIKCAFLKAIMSNCTRSEAQEFTAAFVACRFVKMIKPMALERIDWHRKQGHELVLATASLDVYAEAIGRSLGFEHTVATRAAWRDEKLTGQLDGENLKGEAKLAAVRRLLGDLNREGARIVAYSDDQSDLPLLRFADHGIVVDPTSQFVMAAKRCGLSIEVWNDTEVTAGRDAGPKLSARKIRLQ
jgi:HAD superfamily hydrolase (TIGR01490 family)